ncbi:MAG: tetratricopeptide repeat protein [Candidatus Eisenbacteria sp.]|nr:tetratricopeptide repeat protein [Candidatus Eisenbacteria bacterium]
MNRLWRIPDEAWLFITASCVRGIYMALHTKSIYFDRPILDSLWIHQWAVALAQGTSTGTDAYFRAPLYPYIASLVYRLAGPHPWVMAMLQHLLGGMSVVLVYRVGCRLIDRRTGIIAGLLLAFYWLAIFFEGELLIASFSLFMGLAFLSVLSSVPDATTLQGRSARLIASGAILGLAAIARPNFLALLPLAVFWPALAEPAWADRSAGEGKTRSPAGGATAGSARGQGARRFHAVGRDFLLVLIAAAIPIVPVAVRNLVVADDFVPIASQGGLNLYVGNGPHADGKTAMAPGETGPMPRDQIASHFRDNVTIAGLRIAESEAGHTLKGSEVSNYWLKQTWVQVRSEPWAALGLMLRKVYYSLSAFEVSGNKDLAEAQQESIWSRIAFVRLSWVLPLAWMGVVLLVGRGWRSGLITAFALLYGLSVVLFFVNARLRLPIAPAIFLLAAAGIGQLYNLAGRGNLIRPWSLTGRTSKQGEADLQGIPKGRLVLAGLALVVGVCVSNARLFSVDERRALPAFRLNRATLLIEAGHCDDAIAAYDEALRLDPRMLAAAYGRARAFERCGALEDAASAYEALLRRHAGFAVAHMAHAKVLARLNRLADADTAYRAAIASAPDLPDARFGYGLFLIRQERHEAALEAYQAGLALDPGYVEGWMNQAYALASLGQLGAAIKSWQQVLRLDQGNRMARENIEKAQAASRP